MSVDPSSHVSDPITRSDLRSIGLRSIEGRRRPLCSVSIGVMAGRSVDRSGLRRRAKAPDLSKEAQKPVLDVAAEEKKKPISVPPVRRPTEIVFVIACISFTSLMCVASMCIIWTRVSALRSKFFNWNYSSAV